MSKTKTEKPNDKIKDVTFQKTVYLRGKMVITDPHVSEDRIQTEIQEGDMYIEQVDEKTWEVRDLRVHNTVAVITQVEETGVSPDFDYLTISGVRIPVETPHTTAGRYLFEGGVRDGCEGGYSAFD
jgi:hypothetical protein